MAKVSKKSAKKAACANKAPTSSTSPKETPTKKSSAKKTPRKAMPTGQPPAPAKKSRKTTSSAPSRGVAVHGRVDGSVAGRDLHIHPPPVPPPAPELDIDAYLQALLHDVEHIEIAGIASRPGRSSDALVSKIEDLYTPLSSRPAERGLKDRSRARAPERVLLPELLPKHDRLLLVGQPGSGKTTFLRLVACMLARDIFGPGRSPPWRTEHLGLPARAKPPVPCLLRMSTLVVLFEKHSQVGRPDTRAWLLDMLAVRCHAKPSQVTEALADPHHAARCAQWDALLKDGRAMLLLDGLDEVADPMLRARVFRIFKDACANWPRSQIVVTSRPIDLKHLRALRFHEATIGPLGASEVACFVEQWSTALFQGKTTRSETHGQALLAALRERPEIRRLATNPVMLTCLCVIHWNEGHMPEGRARVYRAIFTWMLQARSLQRTGYGFTDAFAENAFAALALAMTNHAEGKLASFDIGEAADAVDEELRRHVPAFKLELQQRVKTDADRRRLAREWLLRECEWSHIIQEIAGNQLRFWHLTLQEFLAALALAWRDDGEGPEDWWPIVRERLDDTQWRESLDLLPACLYDEGGQRRVDKLVDRVLKLAVPGDLASEARAFGLAGAMLAPMRVYDYRPRPQIAADFAAIQARVMAIFTSEGAEQVLLKTRIAAAEALGRAGDPRLAREELIPVPGTNVEMARYPVTVAEFARFVDDDEGYMSTGWWDADGWAWRAERKREQPWEWDEQKQFPSRPVTSVVWWEARAYCRWLAHRLARAVRLPTVEEWEAAATPQRGKYPWGTAEPNDALANFREAVGAPTPVGLYPAGAGRNGHLDLAGNVWEWCEDGPEARPHERWLKGYSWFDPDLEGLGAAFRAGILHFSDHIGFIGFRVVVVPASRPSRL